MEGTQDQGRFLEPLTSIRDSSLLFCNDKEVLLQVEPQSFLLQSCEAKMMFFLGLKILGFECFKIKAILSVTFRPCYSILSYPRPFYSATFPSACVKHMIKHLLLETWEPGAGGRDARVCLASGE